VLINQLGILKKEEEDMRKYHIHINMYRTEMKHKTTTNHNTNVITEFDNLAYVSGPLSQWVRLSYFCSKLNKYITTVPKGYKTDLVLFYQISRTQQKKRHSNRMTEAPRNGPQRCAPQQLPCIKMALAWKMFSINLL
jgi:hypothetical protein